MGVRPPRHLFQVDNVERFQVEHDAKPAAPVVEIREVERLVDRVVYRDDPKLLDQLNAAYKHIGELKERIANAPILTGAPIVEVERLVFKTKPDKRREALIGALSFAVGVFLCWLMRK